MKDNPINYNPVGVYTQIGVETGVASASPHKLVLMLYDGALHSLNAAESLMRRRDIPAKGQAISKAISIIEELNRSLNLEAGEEIATNLRSLYSYMIQRLLNANLKNDLDLLGEVTRLLSTLREAWAGIGDQSLSISPPLDMPAPRPSVFSYGKA